MTTTNANVTTNETTPTHERRASAAIAFAPRRLRVHAPALATPPRFWTFDLDTDNGGNGGNAGTPRTQPRTQPRQRTRAQERERPDDGSDDGSDDEGSDRERDIAVVVGPPRIRRQRVGATRRALQF